MHQKPIEKVQESNDKDLVTANIDLKSKQMVLTYFDSPESSVQDSLFKGMDHLDSGSTSASASGSSAVAAVSAPNPRRTVPTGIFNFSQEEADVFGDDQQAYYENFRLDPQLTNSISRAGVVGPSFEQKNPGISGQNGGVVAKSELGIPFPTNAGVDREFYHRVMTGGPQVSDGGYLSEILGQKPVQRPVSTMEMHTHMQHSLFGAIARPASASATQSVWLGTAPEGRQSAPHRPMQEFGAIGPPTGLSSRPREIIPQFHQLNSASNLPRDYGQLHSNNAYNGSVNTLSKSPPSNSIFATHHNPIDYSVARPFSASSATTMGEWNSSYANQAYNGSKPLGTQTRPNSQSPMLNFSSSPPSSGVVTGSVVEDSVIKSARDILVDAANHSLKAVELANTLRARVGTEALAVIRDRWGGLLSLLEKRGDVFQVERIPKNDRVTLMPAYLSLSPDDISFSSLSIAGSDCRSSGDPFAMKVANNQQPSRCLHVGNVPAHFTEIHLMMEFEKFGQIDGLKLITQRNGTRRFAFVTYRTVEQAISARHCMSKQYPWKSAISFAHKDYDLTAGNTTVTTQTTSPRNNTGIAVGRLPNYSVDPSKMASRGVADIRYSNQQFPNSVLDQDMGMSGNISIATGNYGYVHSANNTGSTGSRTPPPDGNNNYFANGNSSYSIAERVQPSYNINSAVDDRQYTIDSEVLRRLCDDTYVPTQPWPANKELDLPFCEAVLTQLQLFGGSTTVSKLRGFLRNRVGATDNIKSVPLKAFLSSYNNMFILESNYVSINTSYGYNWQTSSNTPETQL